jgi:hypothetical protein
MSTRDNNSARPSLIVTQKNYRGGQFSSSVVEMPLQLTPMDNGQLASRNSARSSNSGLLVQSQSPREISNPTPTSPPANPGMSRSMRMYDFITGRDKVYSFAQ